MTGKCSVSENNDAEKTAKSQCRTVSTFTKEERNVANLSQRLQMPTDSSTQTNDQFNGRPFIC